MKKKIMSLITLVLLLMLAVSACTAEDPGYVIIDDSTPPNVTTTDDSKTQVINEDGDIIKIDSITDTLVVLTYSHFEIHEGCSFKADIANIALSEDDTLVLAFKTSSDGKLAHMFSEFVTLLGGSLELWEDPTWDSQSGTKVPIYNRKREPPASDSILLENQGQAEFVASNNIILDPTGLDLAGEGQIDIHHYYAFGKKETTVGGATRDEDEFILRNNTQYALVFTSTADVNKAWISLKWYEHENGGE